jgi:hypothetical protein
MKQLNSIQVAIYQFKQATQCEDEKIVITMNTKALVDVVKETFNDASFYSNGLLNEPLRLFGIDVKLCNDYPYSFFTIGFKHYL